MSHSDSKTKSLIDEYRQEARRLNDMADALEELLGRSQKNAPKVKPTSDEVDVSVSPPPKTKLKRTRGKRTHTSGYTLKERLVRVMGSGEHRIPEVVQLLTDRSWLPDSANPSNYVNASLGSEKNTFERVKYGVYRVIPSQVIQDDEPSKGEIDQAMEKMAPEGTQGNPWGESLDS